MPYTTSRRSSGADCKVYVCREQIHLAFRHLLAGSLINRLQKSRYLATQGRTGLPSTRILDAEGHPRGRGLLWPRYWPGTAPGFALLAFSSRGGGSGSSFFSSQDASALVPTKKLLKPLNRSWSPPSKLWSQAAVVVALAAVAVITRQESNGRAALLHEG
jgi:hypothetical protein